MKGAKRESGEKPELPRSGEQERTAPHGTGYKSGKPSQVGLCLQVRRPAGYYPI